MFKLNFITIRLSSKDQDIGVWSNVYTIYALRYGRHIQLGIVYRFAWIPLAYPNVPPNYICVHAYNNLSRHICTTRENTYAGVHVSIARTGSRLALAFSWKPCRYISVCLYISTSVLIPFYCHSLAMHIYVILNLQFLLLGLCALVWLTSTIINLFFFFVW